MQQSESPDNRPEQAHDSGTARQRYIKLAVLVIIAGNIYPLIYLRQNFEVSILESFGITAAQLGQNYAMLGVLYMVTYLPSGWLADRVSPRILMSFSLAFAGLLGLWFSSIPSFAATQWIFAGWGLAAGLTFWSALIKATTLLAHSNEQGRFFGILDGGRGLVEAILATIAVGMFAYYTQNLGQDTPDALRKVIWLYVTCMLVLAPIAYFVLKESADTSATVPRETTPGIPEDSNLWHDLKVVASRKEIWLCGICILTGYQLFWATYSFSAYMQIHYGLTAVAVGSITVAKLWMRPIGAAAAGFAGDFLDRELVLGILLLLASISLASLVILPVTSGSVALLGIVLLIGLLTYAVRGIFWSTLESCNISNRIKGLAIGCISLIGYSPDIYLPLLNGYLLERYPGKLGYSIYFTGIAALGLLGAMAAWQLKRIADQRKREISPGKTTGTVPIA
ncbi:MAG: MFS transporter [Gammaproteobacteria bacterium]|nr:MFS transporter [Gammaproteobacteria bacterium]